MKRYKHILKNRQDAAEALRDVIPMDKLKDESWKLIGVSSGGLELACFLKEKLPNHIDYLFSEAILAPHNNKCEIARVSEREEIVINEKLVEAFEIQYDYIYGEAHRKHEEQILANIYKYRKGRPFFNVKDEIVVLVDEGSETGLKFMTALKTVLSMQPKAVYVVVPVLPSDILELLEPFADEVFYLYAIDDYVETTLYYEELKKVDEEKLEQYLGEKE